MRVIPGPQVQAIIAAHVLGPAAASTQLGGITLHRHQRDGANRALQLVRASRGALVADDVGLGKTFLALAVAREFRQALVVAPAALRDAWARAAARAEVGVAFASIESLARTTSHVNQHDLVVIDEAHHLRNPATKRFAAARRLCASSPVLLLTATPIQNRLADLRVVLSLFLGERAHAMSARELAALVVRRNASDVDSSGLALPTAESPRWLHPLNDVDCLERLMALPPPVAPSDAGDGGALLSYTLVRQWASSRAALLGALRRRIARAHALEDALAQGRRPTRKELSAWCFADGAQQMAFAFMASAADVRPAQLLDHVRTHRLAVSELVARLASSPDPDASRAALLRAATLDNPGRRVVAFSEFAESIGSFYRRLLPNVRVAMLTHAGGRIAGGRITRANLLSRFVPGARAATPERERIDLLLATDVLSEGVDLHDASVVIHLDLPWNPARMTQRVGRVRRIGAPESSVLVYAMKPPAPAEHMLALQRRLRTKLHDAARVVGIRGNVLPDPAPAGDTPAVREWEELADALARWRDPATLTPDDSVCGAVKAERDGFLACVRLNGRAQLVGGGDGVSDDPATVEALLRCAGVGEVELDDPEYEAIWSAVADFLRRRHVANVVDSQERHVARSRRELLRRVNYISRSMPRHSRSLVLPQILAARRVANAPLSAGAEKVLEDLVRCKATDSAWLRALGEFAAAHADSGRDTPNVVLALLVLRRDQGPPRSS